MGAEPCAEGIRRHGPAALRKREAMERHRLSRSGIAARSIEFSDTTGSTGDVRRVAPEIVDIVDTTDHAAGKKPFYERTG